MAHLFVVTVSNRVVFVGVVSALGVTAAAVKARTSPDGLSRFFLWDK